MKSALIKCTKNLSTAQLTCCVIKVSLLIMANNQTHKYMHMLLFEHYGTYNYHAGLLNEIGSQIHAPTSIHQTQSILLRYHDVIGIERGWRMEKNWEENIEDHNTHTREHWEIIILLYIECRHRRFTHVTLDDGWVRFINTTKSVCVRVCKADGSVCVSGSWPCKHVWFLFSWREYN